MRSELKLERFLTALAQNHVFASTQNQAFNAILFFYRRCRHHEAENAKGATCVNTLDLTDPFFGLPPFLSSEVIGSTQPGHGLIFDRFL
ncbi:phage integrase N-terminal SAM-like domain-containing protein [Pedosphaera parvula]|uniref:phage integrase N-terminal SAM-like domain-containing protein n=1 Tax=Pedosphaera parvula TaxID=1032527 RepID=UPI0031B5D4DC